MMVILEKLVELRLVGETDSETFIAQRYIPPWGTSTCPKIKLKEFKNLRWFRQVTYSVTHYLYLSTVRYKMNIPAELEWDY
jgi:hypothetical protein